MKKVYSGWVFSQDLDECDLLKEGEQPKGQYFSFDIYKTKRIAMRRVPPEGRENLGKLIRVKLTFEVTA